MSEATSSKNTSDVKYRRPLNEQQLKVLGWLLKLRFSTSKQIATHLGKADHKAIQSKLQILEVQGFIGKRYDKSYKLAGRAAEYFITPKGTRVFATARSMAIHPNVIKALYKNGTVSSDFLLHCVTVADVVLQLRELHGADKLPIQSPNELKASSYLPEWLPDLLLSYTSSDGEMHRAFLDIWDGSKPFFVTVRKTQNYVKFKEEGDWPTNTQYPAILAICEDKRAQTKLNRQMKRILNDAWDNELIFATTTKQLLDEATKPTDKIWSKVDADDSPELTTLRGLIPEL